VKTKTEAETEFISETEMLLSDSLLVTIDNVVLYDNHWSFVSKTTLLYRFLTIRILHYVLAKEYYMNLGTGDL